METMLMAKDSPGSKQPSSIDWSMCVQRVAGNEVLANDFLLHFVNELQVHRDDFLAQWENKDLKALERNAHKLHGAACFCGVPQLQKNVASLERLARNVESTDLLNDEFLTLMNSIDRVIHDYADHIKAKTGISQC